MNIEQYAHECYDKIKHYFRSNGNRLYCVSWAPRYRQHRAGFRVVRANDVQNTKYLLNEPWRTVGYYDIKDVSLNQLITDMDEWVRVEGQRV